MADVKKIATRESYGNTLKELAAEGHEDLVVLDADLAAATKTGMFRKAYPDRHFDCGIAEENMMGAAFFLHLDIENDHIGPGIPLKLRKNSRLITIFIHNIRIRKKADVSFRPKDGLIAASADATIGKTAETDSSVPRRYLHFLLPQPVALIDDHRIRLQVHMLYGLRKRSIHYRCQNFYLHACSPPCSVFCVCMAPGRK